MTLIKTEVKTFKVDHSCPVCKEGNLQFVGYSDYNNWIMENPPKIPHICNNPHCKEIVPLSEQYPKLIYEEIK